VANSVKFANRKEAGYSLGHLLHAYQTKDAIIIGLVRGGAVVAKAMAQNLHLPFDILVVKKIPSPNNPELALGAVTLDEIAYINSDIVHNLRVPKAYITSEIRRLSGEVKNKDQYYRKDNPSISIKHNVVILVDDGIATGATMKAAVRWAKACHAKKVVVATPVAPVETVREVALIADEVYVLEKPTNFEAVGQFYSEFGQTDDNEVIELLKASV
jgi:putative phosphoribosyl transferase